MSGNNTITIRQNFFSPGTLDPNAFIPSKAFRGPAPPAAPGFPVRYTTGLFNAAMGGNSNSPLRTGATLYPEPGHVVGSVFMNGRKGAVGNG